MTELWVSHNGRPLAGARQLAARRFPNGRPPEASRQPRPAGRRLMEIVLSTSPAPAAPRARVAGGAEEPLLARRIRSSKRRRRDAYGAPRRRRTRARSRRLSLWLRERLYSTRANAALSDLVRGESNFAIDRLGWGFRFPTRRRFASDCCSFVTLRERCPYSRRGTRCSSIPQARRRLRRVLALLAEQKSRY